MQSYVNLNFMWQGIFGIYSILCSILSIYNLTTVCTMHMGKKYMVSAFGINIANLLLVQELANVMLCLEEGHALFGLAKFVGNLPCVVVGACLLTSVFLQGIFFHVVQQKKECMLSPGVIKESLDNLPDGICFFDEEGQPLLVNTQMNRLSGELFQTEILNGKLFWEQLKENGNQEKTKVIVRENVILRHIENGRVWEFRRRILHINSSNIYELVAYDVTKEYSLSRELGYRKQKLGKINKRLRLYSQEVERITAEQEVLSAKIQVHDNVGQALLAFRSYLSLEKEERDRERLLLLWNATVELLRSETIPEPQKNTWDLLLKAASAVDVSIVKKGEFPKGEKERNIFIRAAHECLTNTVKHAKGDKMFLFMEENDTMNVLEITNNGIQPSDPIQETGGLKNLRLAVEQAGGKMSIESDQKFVLRIAFGDCLRVTE